jgi:hypothetical protein
MIRPLGKYVDALYFNLRGEVPEALQRLFDACKLEAQDSEAQKCWFAELPGVPGGEFYVQAKGSKGYPWILRNSRFYVAVTPQKHLPAVQVQPMAQLLYEYDLDGLQEVIDALRGFFGFELPEQVTRYDLAVDFQQAGEGEFKLPDVRDVITRAARRQVIYDRLQAQTLTLGVRNVAVQAIIYAKSSEAAAKKPWMLEVWHRAGFDPSREVWRCELRYFRTVLHQFGINTLADLRDASGDLVRHVLGAPGDDAGTWVRVSNPISRGKQVQTRKAAAWWCVLREKFLDGEEFAGIARSPAVTLVSLVKAVQMATSWMARAAAIARATKLHPASRRFGDFVLNAGDDQLRHKGKSWSQLVAEKSRAMIGEIEPFEYERWKQEVHAADADDAIRRMWNPTVDTFAGALFERSYVHLDLG